MLQSVLCICLITKVLHLVKLMGMCVSVHLRDGCESLTLTWSPARWLARLTSVCAADNTVVWHTQATDKLQPCKADDTNHYTRGAILRHSIPRVAALSLPQ